MSLLSFRYNTGKEGDGNISCSSIDDKGSCSSVRNCQSVNA